LTSRGHEQAKDAGHRLAELVKHDDNIAFYTSPYRRARQTAEGIAAVIEDHQIPYQVVEEPRLREQDFGNFQGDSEEMQRIWTARARYGHFFFRIPNGESAADVYDRCAGFNETLFRQFQRDNFPSVLVLVTHGIWARVFLMKWFGWSYERFESLRNVHHCQFLIMERDFNGLLDKYTLRTKLATWDDQSDSETDSLEELEDASTNSTLSMKELEDIKFKEKVIMQEFQKARTSLPCSDYVTKANQP
jgi:broad specificity phosphatase PhoE